MNGSRRVAKDEEWDWEIYHEAQWYAGLWKARYWPLDPRSPCDNGSCGNSDKSCILVGCDGSRDGERMSRDWAFSLDTWYRLCWTAIRKRFIQNPVSPIADKSH